LSYFFLHFRRAGQRGGWRYASYIRWNKKTATVSVQNKDNVTNIVQSWIAVVDEHHRQKIPLLPPPAVRLKAGEKGFVRILRSGKPLPEERESMFWLNIKGIPAMDSAPDKNMVQFAINSRIKLIFRPRH
jgi:P pilus assembly chaperone PapD